MHLLFSKNLGQLEFRESLVKSLLVLDSGVKHSDFKSACIPSFNENSKRLRCTFFMLMPS